MTPTAVAHTAGPWRVVIPEDAAWAEIHSGQLEVGVAWWGHGYVEGQEFPPIEQAEANAHLIAAAPTMADAGCTLSAYVYSITNPGELPTQVRSAMAVFEALS